MSRVLRRAAFVVVGTGLLLLAACGGGGSGGDSQASATGSNGGSQGTGTGSNGGPTDGKSQSIKLVDSSAKRLIRKSSRARTRGAM